MSVETWGDMPKSQEDAQKVNEAITQAISDHNDDPEAHLGPEQSLQSHRASEIIDHVARSIVGDKVNALIDAFEAADGGISTSHSSTTLVDSTKTWETDQWVGHNIYIPDNENGVDVCIVTGNTATTLTFSSGTLPGNADGVQYYISQIKYSAAATMFVDVADSFNGRAVQLNDADASLEYTFYGNQVDVYALRNNEAGEIEIYLDGVLTDTIILNSDERYGRALVWSYQWDTLTDRTIKIVLTDYLTPGDDQGLLLFEGFDINGTIGFTSLQMPTYAAPFSIATNTHGYGYADIVCPTGFSPILCLSIVPASMDSITYTFPRFTWEFVGDAIRVYAFGGQISHTFLGVVNVLMYKNDPYLDPSELS